MDLPTFVALQGGACTRQVLIEAHGRAAVDAALRHGVLVSPGRGHYALPTSPEHVRRAAAVAGVLSHRSAAARWGWAQREPPQRAEVTVPRTRKLARSARDLVIPHWSDLTQDDVVGRVTTMHRTLVDVSRNLPLDISLPIVDSALRAGDVSKSELQHLADSTRGRGRARIRAVANLASARSANPLESVLRAQCSLVPGLSVEPQLPIHLPGGLVLHPDTADLALRLAVEAEGFEFHGQSVQLTRDCRRYNLLVVEGWTVIRFSWPMVMHNAAYVQRVLRHTVTSLRSSLASGSRPPATGRALRTVA